MKRLVDRCPPAISQVQAECFVGPPICRSRQYAQFSVDNGHGKAYKSAMDYPTVTVRIDDASISAEVDIAPRPSADNLVTVTADEQAPTGDAPSRGLPTWLLYAG